MKVVKHSRSLITKKSAEPRRFLELLASLLFSVALTARSQPAQKAAAHVSTETNLTEWSVVERAANSRIWQRITSHPGVGTNRVQKIHRYQELQPGLHRWHPAQQQWVECDETITPTPEGAAATNCAIQAYFLGNLNSPTGAMTLLAPDGKIISSSVLGIAYADASNSVMIAPIKDCFGQILASGHDALYPDSFSNIVADVQYGTGKKGVFESFVIFRQQLPSPSDYGLDPANTWLQVWTEFFGAAPFVSTVQKADGQEDFLDFGVLQMIEGQAFALGAETNRIPVRKQWVTTQDGRVALVEQVRLQNLLPLMQDLPAPAGGSARLRRPRNVIGYSNASAKPAPKKWVFHLPPRQTAHANSGTMKLASVTPPSKGLAADYQLVVSQSNLVFQADMTYYLNSYITLVGTNTFEGCSVIKATANSGFRLVPSSSPVTLNFVTGFYRPAVVTAVDDCTIGETISGASCSPSGNYYANPAFYVASGTFNFPHLRVLYAAQGIQSQGANITVSDAQFVDCGLDFSRSSGGTLTLRNVLCASAGTNISATGSFSLDAENCTFCGSSWLVQCPSSSATLEFTNSIFVNETNLCPANVNLNGLCNAFQSTPTTFGNRAISLGSLYPFQTVGASDYYIADAADPYLRRAGTTNINATLLADLAQATTYPPVVFDQDSLTNALDLSPQAQRDTGIPDLGWHADALDYAFGGCDLYTNLTLEPGTAVGWFEDWGQGSSGIWEPYSLSLNDGSVLVSKGTALQSVWYPRTMTVQEGVNGNWQNNGWMAGFVLNGSGNPPYPQLNDHFARWSTLASGGNDFRDNWAYGIIKADNCEYYSGSINSYWGPQYFTNCLFYRVAVYFWDQVDSPNITFQNCTLYNGFLDLCRYSWQSSFTTAKWDIENNAFDGTGFAEGDDYHGTENTTFDHNAYNTNNLAWQSYPFPYPPQYGMLEVTNVTDRRVGSYGWESGFLGNFYLPAGGPLINTGSLSAASSTIGLFHFTVMTNLLANGLQIKETNSIVDLGVHYVATDSNGVPISTAGDGWADYLKNVAGTGVYESGVDPFNWTNYFSTNGLTSANGLEVFTPLK